MQTTRSGSKSLLNVSIENPNISDRNKSLAFGSQPVLESSSEPFGEMIVSSTWKRGKVGVFAEQSGSPGAGECHGW